jgi:hypothetical protein
MLFFIVVGFLIALNMFLYFFVSRLPFTLWASGFLAGLFVAKIFVIVGY